MQIGGFDVARAVTTSVLGLATAGIVMVSIRANFLFGYSLGQSADKAHVFGWANVATDLWKVAGLILIRDLWRSELKRFAAVLFPLWCLCVAWGMLGAISMYAQDRLTVIGGREFAARTQADHERELGELRTQLAALPKRTAAQVAATIASVFARPVKIGERYRGTVRGVSAGCTIDDRATAEACAQIVRLQEEEVGADTAALLQSRIAEIEQSRSALLTRGAALPADPIADFLRWISGGRVTEQSVIFGFPLAFALLLETISAVGPAALIAYVRSASEEGQLPDLPEVAADDELCPPKARLSEPDQVAHWLNERTLPTSVVAPIGCAELYGDFTRWCASHNITACSADAFEHAFDTLRRMPELVAVRKISRSYSGIAFAARK